MSFRLLAAHLETERHVDGLDGVDASEHTSASNTTQDVRAGALHQRHEALVLHNLRSAVERRRVLHGSAGRHHHAAADRVERVPQQTGHNRHGPAEREVQREVVNRQQNLQRVVQTEVEATVDDDTGARHHEAAVQADRAVGLERLHVHVQQAVELALTATLLRRLHVVGEAGTGVVQRVHEQQRRRTSETAGRHVGAEPLEVALILLHVEHLLEGVLEGEVQRLRGEVAQHVGPVATPQGNDAVGSDDTLGALKNTVVLLVEDALLDHLVLVLDQQLNTLDGGRERLRDTGRHTTDHELLVETELGLLRLVLLGRSGRRSRSSSSGHYGEQ